MLVRDGCSYSNIGHVPMSKHVCGFVDLKIPEAVNKALSKFAAHLAIFHQWDDRRRRQQGVSRPFCVMSGILHF